MEPHISPRLSWRKTPPLRLAPASMGANFSPETRFINRLCASPIDVSSVGMWAQRLANLRSGIFHKLRLRNYTISFQLPSSTLWALISVLEAPVNWWSLTQFPPTVAVWLIQQPVIPTLTSSDSSVPPVFPMSMPSWMDQVHVNCPGVDTFGSGMLQKNVFQWPIPSTDHRLSKHGTSSDTAGSFHEFGRIKYAHRRLSSRSRLGLCFINPFSTLNFHDVRGTTVSKCRGIHYRRRFCWLYSQRLLSLEEEWILARTYVFYL